MVSELKVEVSESVATFRWINSITPALARM